MAKLHRKANEVPVRDKLMKRRAHTTACYLPSDYVTAPCLRELWHQQLTTMAELCHLSSAYLQARYAVTYCV